MNLKEFQNHLDVAFIVTSLEIIFIAICMHSFLTPNIRIFFKPEYIFIDIFRLDRIILIVSGFLYLKVKHSKCFLYKKEKKDYILCFVITYLFFHHLFPINVLRILSTSSESSAVNYLKAVISYIIRPFIGIIHLFIVNILSISFLRYLSTFRVLQNISFEIMPFNIVNAMIPKRYCLEDNLLICLVYILSTSIILHEKLSKEVNIDYVVANGLFKFLRNNKNEITTRVYRLVFYNLATFSKLLLCFEFLRYFILRFLFNFGQIGFISSVLLQFRLLFFMFLFSFYIILIDFLYTFNVSRTIKIDYNIKKVEDFDIKELRYIFNTILTLLESNKLNIYKFLNSKEVKKTFENYIFEEIKFCKISVFNIKTLLIENKKNDYLNLNNKVQRFPRNEDIAFVNSEDIEVGRNKFEREYISEDNEFENNEVRGNKFDNEYREFENKFQSNGVSNKFESEFEKKITDCSNERFETVRGKIVYSKNKVKCNFLFGLIKKRIMKNKLENQKILFDFSVKQLQKVEKVLKKIKNSKENNLFQNYKKIIKETDDLLNEIVSIEESFLINLHAYKILELKNQIIK